MLLLVNKLHFRLLGFTPRRSLSSSLTLIVNSTIVMPSRFVTAASHHCCGGLGSCWGIGAAHSIWMLVRVFEAVARARSGTCTPVHVYR